MIQVVCRCGKGYTFTDHPGNIVCHCGRECSVEGEQIRREVDAEEESERDIDSRPYSKRARQKGVLRVTHFPRHPARRAVVVGKGESAERWRDIPDVDVYFTINEACYALDRACYAVRGDGTREDHRFMEWLPSFCTPIMPARLRCMYGYGWYFLWEDIGLDNICLTTLMAIRLAHYLVDAQQIICCGLDALHLPGSSYDPNLANPRNESFGVADQRSRVRILEPFIYDKCSHWNGDPLVVDWETKK